ncbi:hypothetical protein ACLOJK_018127 [Asimina triloba]
MLDYGRQEKYQCGERLLEFSQELKIKGLYNPTWPAPTPLPKTMVMVKPLRGKEAPKVYSMAIQAEVKDELHDKLNFNSGYSEDKLNFNFGYLENNTRGSDNDIIHFGAMGYLYNIRASQFHQLPPGSSLNHSYWSGPALIPIVTLLNFNSSCLKDKLNFNSRYSENRLNFNSGYLEDNTLGSYSVILSALTLQDTHITSHDFKTRHTMLFQNSTLKPPGTLSHFNVARRRRFTKALKKSKRTYEKKMEWQVDALQIKDAISCGVQDRDHRILEGKDLGAKSTEKAQKTLRVDRAAAWVAMTKKERANGGVKTIESATEGGGQFKESKKGQFFIPKAIRGKTFEEDRKVPLEVRQHQVGDLYELNPRMSDVERQKIVAIGKQPMELILEQVKIELVG